MSEYQYYEFQAIDRPLTEEEQRAVSRLSSRVDPHPRRAVFVYNYSDLPANEQELLVKYYDAMFYIANWGTTRLMFRFPQALIDVRQIESYCVEDAVTCETIGEYVVLDIFWNDEGGEYSDWVEGEGFLDGLISLREAILRQDYRVLYLAWLSAFHIGMVEEDEVEPPVPPGLQKLTPALRRFIEAFHVDESLVAAAMPKPAPPPKHPHPLPCVKQLPPCLVKSAMNGCCGWRRVKKPICPCCFNGLGDAVLWRTIPVIWPHPGSNYRTILCELFPTFVPQRISLIVA